ncbi:hypothetical protein AGMMS49545_14080 [Betaproteobacteria bacterium]|nr:hypothetical protein AGMMS49545_14080 [Betaproteobacteria bacterium]GHU45698.1 hypothetical protein AGMMS50289_17430 [Betaproteobacteria bacterium]
MREEDISQGTMFSNRTQEERIPQDHPLRKLRVVVNRLVVDVETTRSGGTAEREAAKVMVGHSVKKGSTLGADKGYEALEFVEALREASVTPHIAQKRNSALSKRTTRHPGDAISLQKRKRVGLIVNFFKSIGEVISPNSATRKMVNAIPSENNPFSLEFRIPKNGENVFVNDIGGIRISGMTEVRVGGKLAFVTPSEQLMTFARAEKWYREQAASIENVLKDTDLPLNFKLQQACQLRQAQQQGAMNALGDPDLAAEFAATYRLDSLERIKSDLMHDKKVSGDELFDSAYRELTEVKMRTPDMPGGCFTKGTLVHTQEGQRPSEEIKVGDYVLSSPEDGSVQPEYKQVVNTFVFRDKVVKEVAFTKRVNEDHAEIVAATGDHPFWAEGKGWTRADELNRLLKNSKNASKTPDFSSFKNEKRRFFGENQQPVKGYDKLRKTDGSFSIAANTSHIFRIPEWHPGTKKYIGLGWVFDGQPFVDRPDGSLYDYENNRYEQNKSSTFYYPDDLIEENYLKATAYNLEVEDFHTYYVGETGIWVHNNNCMTGGQLS